MVAATLAMLTIAPPLPAAPPGRMARNPCLMPSVVPTTLTSYMRRRSAGSTSTISEEISMPALLTRTSKPPSSATVAATACSQLASSVTSRWVNPVVAPVLPISCAVSVPSSSRTSPIITAAPARASASAMPCPSPRAPPVTSALRPCSSKTDIPCSSPSRETSPASNGSADVTPVMLCCVLTTVKTFLDSRQELCRAGRLRPGGGHHAPADGGSTVGSAVAERLEGRAVDKVAAAAQRTRRRRPEDALRAGLRPHQPARHRRRTPSSPTASCTTTSATRST